MPTFPAAIPVSFGLDLWLNATLALAMIGLVWLSYRDPRRRRPGPREWKGNASRSRSQEPRYPDGLRQIHISRHDHERHFGSLKSQMRALPSVRSRAGWTTEMTMRILCSMIILMAAVYIILFDHEASGDKQKWAFGAVGLVFGHWTKS